VIALSGVQANKGEERERVRRKRKRRKDQKKSSGGGGKSKSGASEHVGTSLTLAHWNARGLDLKTPVLKKKMTELGIDLCGIAESHTYRNTHLSDDKWIWDPGVENRPNSAQAKPPGGIGTVVSREVTHSIVAAGKHSVWVRLELEGDTPVFIGECYFPHSTKVRQHRLAWAEVADRAREFAETGHIVLMGDFNAHVGLHGDPTDAAGRMLLRRTRELKLRVLNGTDLCEGNSTRIMEFQDGSATSTTIDFVMVSESLMPNVSGMMVVADRMGSDHCMTTLKLVGLQPAPGPIPELREAWRVENIPHHKDASYEVMVQSFQSVFRGWLGGVRSAIDALEGGDGDLANELEKSFQVQLDEVTLEELGAKLIGPRSTGLMTKKIKEMNSLRAEREAELRQAITDRNCDVETRAAAIKAYRRAKADALGAVQARKDELELQIFEQIEAAQSDSKLFWSRMSTISGPLSSNVAPPPLAMNTDGKVVTEVNSVLKVWRDFWSSITNPSPEDEYIYDEDHKREVEERLDNLRSKRLSQHHLDKPISEVEVFAAIRKLKCGKAPGVDGVTTTILKMAADAVGTSTLKPDNPVVEALVLLFNYVFEHEVWPERWATGIIFPLYKQDSRLLPGNYRPITLLSVVGKLFGSVVESRLSAWGENNLALADEQGGFRRSRGTADLIFQLREVILARKSRGQCTLATFIDARKAYDTVWREGNFVRLWDMGVRGKLWRQLQAMSADPKSKVRLPFGETEYFRITRGVAQGAVESPFLYACFINALADELKQKGLGIIIAGRRIPLLMYADDVVFMASTVSELREMNRCVTEFARRNRYQLNGDKSAVMAFNADAATKAQVANEPWVLSGEEVKVKRSYKYLGVDILEDVTDWKPYITRAIIKASRVTEDLEWACRRSGGLRPRAAAALWKAIVRPILEYAAEIWAGDIGEAEARAAEKVQTDFARSILGIVGLQSISNDSLRAEMGMEKLASRWTKLRLGYWRRIQVASSERSLVAIASLRRKHVLWGLNRAGESWMRGTRDLLETYGLREHWMDPALSTNMPKDKWREVVFEAVEGRADTTLAAKFASMKGIASERYARMKHWDKVPPELAVMSGEIGKRGAQVIERYLDSRAEPIGTRLKLMCRLGCLPTMTRLAREENLPSELGMCKLCGLGEEDTRHVVLECPTHAFHRAKMTERADKALLAAGIEPLRERSDENQLEILLGKTTGVAKVDQCINQGVTRFLKKAWRGRNWLTSSMNDKLGRADTVWALRAHGEGECHLGVPAPRIRRKRITYRVSTSS